MNTTQLECFLAVANYLNFSRAAEQLRMTQPAVSHQINALEDELGVKLFHRTSKRVRLTEEGTLFLHDAQHIVGIAVRAKKRFETPYGPEFHILSLGCYSFANLSLLPPALKRLSEQYPDLHPQLQAVPFQHLYQMLEEDEVDAVIGFREPESKRISAHYRELGRARVVCVCAPDHPLSGCSSVKIEDLAEEKLVLIDPARTQADAARLQGQLMDGRSPSSVYFCESAEAASILVRAGFGISILPDLFLPPESLLARMPVDGVTPISFGIYYKSLQDNPPLQSLIQLLQKGLSTVDGDCGV